MFHKLNQVATCGMKSSVIVPGRSLAPSDYQNVNVRLVRSPISDGSDYLQLWKSEIAITTRTIRCHSSVILCSAYFVQLDVFLQNLRNVELRSSVYPAPPQLRYTTLEWLLTRPTVVEICTIFLRMFNTSTGREGEGGVV